MENVNGQYVTTFLLGGEHKPATYPFIPFNFTSKPTLLSLSSMYLLRDTRFQIQHRIIYDHTKQNIMN